MCAKKSRVPVLNCIPVRMLPRYLIMIIIIITIIIIIIIAKAT